MVYPSTATHTEELVALIKSNAPETVDIIKEYIDNHDVSSMNEGVRYYFNESDITKRKIYTYENDVKVEDEDATNYKLPTSKHKLLVDQKVAYLAGKPPTLTSKIEDDPALEVIRELLGDDFEDTLPELIKHSSNKGREWLHPYIDVNGEFDTIIVPAQEGIPIYDNTKRKNLIGFIRVYPLDDDTKKIELWDDQRVTYYEEIDGEIVMDMSYDENPQSHFYYGNGENNKGYGWNKVPFIEFKNNEEAVGDLVFYKKLIDAFELIISDNTNTIIDVQAIVWILKGYEGTSLEEFMTNLKKFKAINISDEDNASADTAQADIPTEAIDSQTKRLAELIYEAGQGVDMSADKMGNDPSGVALQFMYSFLDMKANVLERKFNKGLKTLMWFICEYLEITGNKKPDYKNYEFVFNKSMITNQTEQISNANSSMGIVSKTTVLENHPFVTDIATELERLEEEQKEFDVRQEPLGGDEIESTGD